MTRKFTARLIQKYSFGGGTVNDTTVHFADHRLPFGGVGFSGTGAYQAGIPSTPSRTRKGSANAATGWISRCDMLLIRGNWGCLKFFLKWLGRTMANGYKTFHLAINWGTAIDEVENFICRVVLSENTLA